MHSCSSVHFWHTFLRLFGWPSLYYWSRPIHAEQSHRCRCNLGSPDILTYAAGTMVQICWIVDILKFSFKGVVLQTSVMKVNHRQSVLAGWSLISTLSWQKIVNAFYCQLLLMDCQIHMEEEGFRRVIAVPEQQLRTCNGNDSTFGGRHSVSSTDETWGRPGLLASASYVLLWE